MNPLIVIGLLSGLPVFLIVLLRANAAVAFLALCAGDLAAKYLGDDAIKLMQTFSSRTDPLLYSATRIGLLVLPMILTILFLRKGIRGAGHAFNIIPAVLTGVVTALLSVPLLTDGTKANIYGTRVWSIVTQMQGTVVGVAVLTSMLMLWMTQKSIHKRRHH